LYRYPAARALHYKRGLNPIDTYTTEETLKILRKTDKSNGT
jgi:hypothetical protein